jgi:predicted polyphosphate/ATP-dependent NAD kinase
MTSKLSSPPTVCITLYGTNDGTWRDAFIADYLAMGLTAGVNFYVPTWTTAPELAAELQHLENDKVVVFAITGETYAEQLLSDLAFYILNTHKPSFRRSIIIYVDPDIVTRLKFETDGQTLQERAVVALGIRTAVRDHLQQLRLDGTYFVQSLEDALAVSKTCYNAEVLLSSVRQYIPHGSGTHSSSSSRAAVSSSSSST